MLGIDYEIIVSNADEVLEEGVPLIEQSKKLGFIKAKTVFDETSGDRIVIGSDTMVMKDGKLYGKPKDRQDAVRMLNELKNAKHQVYTSLAILVQQENTYQEYVDCDITDVYFSDITQEEIEQWIDTGNVYDRAGAYAIQSKFSVFVEKIDGNVDTVIGLPIHKLYQVLKQYIEI